MVLEFLLRVPATSAAGDTAMRMAGKSLAAMAAGGIHDQLAGGFARYGVDRAWVVPHFEKMLYDNAQLLSVYAHWASRYDDAQAGEVALRDRALPADRAADRRGRVRLRPGRRLGGGGGHLLRLDPRAAGRGARPRRRCLGRFAPDRDGARAPSRTAAPPSSCSSSRTTRRGGSPSARACSRPAPTACGRTATTRWSLRGTGWRSPAWSRRARCSANRSWSRLRCGAASSWPAYTCGPVGSSESPATAWPGAHAGVLEDYGAVASGFLSLACATGDGVWVGRAGQLLDVVLERFAAEDGGFHDTADDAEALLARPRDPSDNAYPSGHSAALNALALVRRAHRLRPAPRRRRASPARHPAGRRLLAALRRLGPRRGADRPRRSGGGGDRRPRGSRA